MPKTAKKAAPKKPKPAAAPASVEQEPVQELKLDRLDVSPAEAVRDRSTDAARRRIAEAVERYAEADRLDPGRLPPVAAFRGKTITYVGDGSCRVAAAAANARETVRCHVHTFPTDAAALAAARRCAWTANGTHGLPRTNDDKRAVVRNMLLSSPADTSDNRIKGVTRFSNELIRNVREAMTRDKVFPPGDPRRADVTGRYDPNARRRGGVPTGKTPEPAGSVKPSLKTPAAGTPNGGQNDTPDDDGRDDGEAPPAPDAAPIPDRLLGLFRERGRIGRAVVVLAELTGKDAKPLHIIPGFVDLVAAANELAVQLNQVKPDAVCDRCKGVGDEAGEVCPRCDGRGWTVRVTVGRHEDPVRVPAAA